MAGALDEDAARTLASGRQRVGAVLSTAQDKLKRIFLVFVVAFLGTFWALRAFVWDRLEQDLVYRHMSERVAQDTEIIATTPFEVILLQVKIGLIMGVLVAIPATVWYGRAALRRRDRWPDAPVPRWKLWAFAVLITLLFFGGLSYAYFFFFPIMFDFLATNAVNAGFKATWSIAMWTEFILFLGLSFGLAAQLPLAMSSTARMGIVKYETFREKWRYAVLGIFVFGAMFSPPDPFTQLMWGVPLVALYFVSLGITKLAVASKRAGEAVSAREVAEENWNHLFGAGLVTFAFVYLFLLEGGGEATNDVLEAVGSDYRVAEGGEIGVLGLSPTFVASLVGALVAFIVMIQLVFYFRMVELERLAKEQTQSTFEETQDDSEPGEPAEMDIGAMSARAIEAASPEAFLELSEERALHHAEQAMENDEPQKAQAIFDKFDEAETLREEREAEQTEEQEDEEAGFVTSATANIVDPLTEDETTEDDIGGYYYDIQFIIESLTSKTMYLVGTFMVVLAGSFLWMYSGGIGYLADQFFGNMPAEAADQADIVVLHPVEALIFMLKFSTVLAFLSIVPIALYFAWPAIENRGLASGNRNVLLYWGGTTLVALIGGTLLGFLYIAPTVISLLAWDVVSSDMIIAYRISSFGWLVIYLTVGVGILVMIPVTMLLFHHGSIISYRRMRKSWRVAVLAFFAIAGFVSPSGLYTMFIVAIPAALAYGFGLGCLWVYTRFERRIPSRTREEVAD